MITVRQIEKSWRAKQWGKLLRSLLANRPENSLRLETEMHSSVAAAALAMIRLDELNQTHTSLFSKLLKTLLCSQDPDGGWRDPMTTALCIRALLIDRGQGLAIDRGLAFLANLQKSEGAWPKEPIRRLDADGFTTAFILFQLADKSAFRNAVRFEQPIRWMDDHREQLDPEAERLCNLIGPRYRAARINHAPATPLWT